MSSSAIYRHVTIQDELLSLLSAELFHQVGTAMGRLCREILQRRSRGTCGD